MTETPGSSPASEPLRSRRRTVLLALGGTLGLVVVVAGVAGVLYLTRDLPDPLAAPRQPLLPDLVMPRIDDLQIGIDRATGQQTLMFTATIGNVGEGPLLIHAVRRNRFSSGWRVTQRFAEADGTQSEIVTPSDLVWGGHGHDHWHVRFGASYVLEPLAGDRSKLLRKVYKAGFCFWDHVRAPRARPTDPTTRTIPNTTCDGIDRTSVEMGMSTGWQDPYYNFLPDQEFDITGLPDGRYRLRATADPDHVLREQDEGNNITWLDLELVTSTRNPSFRVVGVGPNAGPRGRL